eukprot:4569598-Alexandrium_andersonii.AAC.1
MGERKGSINEVKSRTNWRVGRGLMGDWVDGRRTREVRSGIAGHLGGWRGGGRTMWWMCGRAGRRR